jgi:hypothetical protein
MPDNGGALCPVLMPSDGSPVEVDAATVGRYGTVDAGEAAG